MNKGIFRLVFNVTCGQPVAVAEIASSQSKAPGGPVHVAVASSRSRSLAVAVSAIQMGVFIALGWVYLLSPVGSYTAMAQTLAPAVSNIVADPNAPRTQQATFKRLSMHLRSVRRRRWVLKFRLGRIAETAKMAVIIISSGYEHAHYDLPCSPKPVWDTYRRIPATTCRGYAPWPPCGGCHVV
jgi:hypothetical protein